MKHGLLFLLLLFLGVGLAAQDLNEKKRMAKELFSNDRYEEALAMMMGSRQLSREDQEARFLMALCYYQLNELDDAFRIFNELIGQERSTYPECWLFLGKIFHARHQFAEAIDYYKAYLGLTDSDASTRRLIWDDIRRCAVGMEMQYWQSAAFVENMGSGVNTKYDEFAPVISPNVNERLYFSSAREGSIGGLRSSSGMPDLRYGQYFSDIYSCRLQDGMWGSVEAMHYLLNSPRHEVLLDFSKDGQVLYYYKGMSLDNGEILVDTFRRAEERVISSTPLLGPFNARTGDQFPYFYNDTLVFFSSRRPGGYGGYDIYRTVWRGGRWTMPENLGPLVNTPYDEVTPFLSRNGEVLYFSSNRSDLSIGGLDVLRSRYNYKTGRWMLPDNVGMPINSSADDMYFRLARDGFSAFFSSARKDGFGQRDLYVAYFSDFLEEQELPLTYQPAPAAFDPSPFVPSDPPPVPADPPPRQTEIPDRSQDAPRSGDLTPPPSSNENNGPAIRPLVLKGAELSFSGDQQEVLDRLARELTNNPALRVVITGYASTGPGVNGRLRRAMEAAEKAGQYLLEHGTGPDAIYLKAINVSWTASGAAAATLVDFSLVGDNAAVPPVSAPSGEAPAFPPDLMTDRPLVYKVQIGSAVSLDFEHELLENNPYPMVEKGMGTGFYRYSVGAVPTFAEAFELRREMMEQGGAFAFVVPYVHRIRPERSQLEAYQEDFPDLYYYFGSKPKD